MAERTEVEEPLDPEIEAEVERQLAHVMRATVEVHTVDELRAKLRRSIKTGKPLRN